jgi:hypothetical protein
LLLATARLASKSLLVAARVAGSTGYFDVETRGIFDLFEYSRFLFSNVLAYLIPLLPPQFQNPYLNIKFPFYLG